MHEQYDRSERLTHDSLAQFRSEQPISTPQRSPFMMVINYSLAGSPPLRSTSTTLTGGGGGWSARSLAFPSAPITTGDSGFPSSSTGKGVPSRSCPFPSPVFFVLVASLM
jgi:hypothetical protein